MASCTTPRSSCTHVMSPCTVRTTFSTMLACSLSRHVWHPSLLWSYICHSGCPPWRPPVLSCSFPPRNHPLFLLSHMMSTPHFLLLLPHSKCAIPAMVDGRWFSTACIKNSFFAQLHACLFFISVLMCSCNSSHNIDDKTFYGCLLHFIVLRLYKSLWNKIHCVCSPQPPFFQPVAWPPHNVVILHQWPLACHSGGSSLHASVGHHRISFSHASSRQLWCLLESPYFCQCTFRIALELRRCPAK